MLKLPFFALLTCAVLGCQKEIGRAHDVKKEQNMNMNAEQNFQEGSEVFFVVKTRELIPSQKATPEGFYVKGKIERGRFKPKSGVLGIGNLANEGDGRFGWLELNSKEFFPMESSRKADMPFLKGYMIEEEFKPSEREVIDMP